MRNSSRRTVSFALALAVAATCIACFAGVAQAAFGVNQFSGSLLTAEVPAGTPGTPQLQAGAHPDLTTTFEMKVKNAQGVYFSDAEVPDGNSRELIGYGPPGLIGNTTVVPTCTFTELTGSGSGPFCSPQAQVGRMGAILYTAGRRFVQTFAVYNMVPPIGTPARFGVNVAGVLVFIDAKVVNRDGTYSIALESHNISEGLPLGGVILTLWGVPASHAHDSVRQPRPGETPPAKGPQGAPTELAMMSNPTYCSGSPLEFSGRAASWQGESAIAPPFTSDTAGRPLVVTGCENVPFEATFSAQPTTQAAESPTGLVTTINVPQSAAPNGVSTSDLRDAVIRLPQGLSVNPASATGLESCSAAQANLDGEAPAACPAGSKIGTVSIDTPVLEHPLEGSVYLARQGENKFGSLLALYLAVDDPTTGIVLKLPGKVETGPDGRLTASFTENPQLPFETLKVELFGGSRAPLMTPGNCGTYQSTATFSPWSGTAPVNTESSFKITSGPGGTACPNGGFNPALAAGSSNPVAGAYSPFVFDVSREDGTQGLGSITAGLPQGLLAKLAGVPYCSDTALASISGAEGTAGPQVGTPSCPAASQVGTVSVGAGAGPNPFSLRTGKAYLAGPYKGAPLSLAVVVPALAGPFDLGNVAVRTALRVDPATAQVTAVSDSLPTILHGIPVDLRDLRVDVDGKEFTRNPTSCEPTAVTSTIASVTGTQAHPQSRYQVAGCATLPFRPKLSLRVLGKTNRNAKPRFRAVLTAAPGEAGIGRAQVNLPHSLFLEQGHLQTICTRVQWNAGAGHGSECPKGTVYGWARAFTPLLEKPLEGPVYLRSSSHKLPDLVAALNGQIDIELDAKVDSGPNQGLRTTFESVPDAPVSKFVLTMKGGKKGILVNSEDLCSKRSQSRPAIARLRGQNGKVESLRTKVAAKCHPTKAG